MLLAAGSGGLNTTTELTGWLRDAGFAQPETIALPAWAGSTLIVAEQP